MFVISLQQIKKKFIFLSIIDYLTPYDWKKVIAHNAKSTKYTSEELSTVNAQFYCDRFINFFGTIIV